MNESEKISINLGVVEIAQIDVLVEQGHFSNRTDFIRTAVRKELEVHKNKIERQYGPITDEKYQSFGVGIATVSHKFLEDWAASDVRKINYYQIGMLIFDKKISLELFEKTVGSVTVRGKLVASDEIKEAIEKMNS